MQMSKEIMPGDRILVFEHLLFKDDIKTPLSMTMKPATVVCRYGYILHNVVLDIPPGGWKYPDVVDIIFDHRPDKVSRGHFTDAVESLIKEA
jgi:hypothetical protein